MSHSTERRPRLSEPEPPNSPSLRPDRNVPPDATPSSRRALLTNLSYDSDETEIQDFFLDAGCRVRKVIVIGLKSQAKRSNGNALVFFEDERSLEISLKKNGATLRGRTINVSILDANYRTACVRGFNPRAHRRDVEELFRGCKIIDIRSIPYRGSTRPDSLTWFVDFADDASFEIALALDRSQPGLMVCVATAPGQRHGTPRSRDEYDRLDRVRDRDRDRIRDRDRDRDRSRDRDREMRQLSSRHRSDDHRKRDRSPPRSPAQELSRHRSDNHRKRDRSPTEEVSRRRSDDHRKRDRSPVQELRSPRRTASRSPARKRSSIDRSRDRDRRGRDRSRSRDRLRERDRDHHRERSLDRERDRRSSRHDRDRSPERRRDLERDRYRSRDVDIDRWSGRDRERGRRDSDRFLGPMNDQEQLAEADRFIDLGLNPDLTVVLTNMPFVDNRNLASEEVYGHLTESRDVRVKHIHPVGRRNGACFVVLEDKPSYDAVVGRRTMSFYGRIVTIYALEKPYTVRIRMNYRVEHLLADLRRDFRIEGLVLSVSLPDHAYFEVPDLNTLVRLMSLDGYSSNRRLLSVSYVPPRSNGGTPNGRARRPNEDFDEGGRGRDDSVKRRSPGRGKNKDAPGEPDGVGKAFSTCEAGNNGEVLKDSPITPSPVETVPGSKVATMEVVSERVDRVKEDICASVEEQGEIPYALFILQLPSLVEQQEIVHTRMEEHYPELRQVWAGSVCKGREHTAKCVGYLVPRTYADEEEISKAIALLPKDLNIEHRVKYSGTGFEHLLGPESVVFMVCPDPAERNEEHRRYPPSSRSVLRGVIKSLTVNQRVGLVQHSVENKKIATLCVPPTEMAYDRLNIPWKVKDMAGVDSIFVIVGKKKKYKD